MSTTSFPIQETMPITVPVTVGARWMIGAVMLALLVYYFVGVDQGAVSVLGTTCTSTSSFMTPATSWASPVTEPAAQLS